MIPFIDLQAQRARIADKIDAAVLHVVHSGAYIMGPEIDMLEKNMADFCGAKHVISCANGTDALALGLMAKQVRPGDAILVPSFTFAATAEVVAWLGATAIFIDSQLDTMNIDPAQIESGIALARSMGLRPVGIIPVDLFGLPADFDAIDAIARAHNMWVMMDTAQGFGGVYKGRVTGSMGEMATTSFFPAKPLGCYGDGGAFFCADDDLAALVKSLRVHGQGVDKYDNIRIGMNGRLDTMQAAVLIEKLKIFPDEITERNAVAARYTEGLQDVVITPTVPDGYVSTWAQYTVRVPGGRRDALAAYLKDQQIPTMVYYSRPLHQQTAYKKYPCAGGTTLPHCDQLAGEVLSLPMHPYLDVQTQDRIMDSVRGFLRQQAA